MWKLSWTTISSLFVVWTFPIVNSEVYAENDIQWTTAWVNITYKDPHTGQVVSEKHESGRYGSQLIQNAKGWVVPTKPKYGCAPLQNDFTKVSQPWIALISRGNCTFTDKFTNAIAHNASAVVIYNSGDELLTMSYQGFQESRAKRKQCGCLSKRRGPAVLEIPKIRFRADFFIRSVDAETYIDAECCAVCIDPYKSGEVIRVLPCKHLFHKACVDQWLVEHRTCPMCKLNILKALGHDNQDSQESLAIQVEVVTPGGSTNGNETEEESLGNDDQGVVFEQNNTQSEEPCQNAEAATTENLVCVWVPEEGFNHKICSTPNADGDNI
ncbi:RING finger protein 150-like [Saccoglossus kowalevskii]|uniref:RING finger protein 150-like n=1 Tax=Saccoglossus kowalevskii TaxID=10224 RepID=A0ABM0MLD2_SACKO|nr:PREDICTED: RING finger protein 150-like [Saccoglossus kowalevskii]